MPYIILTAGLYLLIVTFAVTVDRQLHNVILFRVLPFVLGIILLAHAVKSLGWLALL